MTHRRRTLSLSVTWILTMLSCYYRQDHQTRKVHGTSQPHFCPTGSLRYQITRFYPCAVWYRWPDLAPSIFKAESLGLLRFRSGIAASKLTPRLSWALDALLHRTYPALRDLNHTLGSPHLGLPGLPWAPVSHRLQSMQLRSFGDGDGLDAHRADPKVLYTTWYLE
jgi:hypothetical protein